MQKQIPKNKVELIAPAGSLWKLKTAILYGADAVYCGFGDLNLRVRAENFTFEEMAEGIEFAHAHNAKVYLTLNAFLFENDLKLFRELAEKAIEIKPDAVIVSDPAAVDYFKMNAPHIKLHLSTQAGCMNSQSAEFWKRQGISRVILAREVTFEQLKQLRQNTDCEIEMFVHGAMCAAVSGRCLLSSYLASREADQGDCQQPCRWIYTITDVKSEDKMKFPVLETNEGTTIFSAKDLCLFEYLPQLINLGINGFKIEGRIKTDFYVAMVVRAYHKAINSYYNNPKDYQIPQQWFDELFKISHREYSTGFLFGREKISQTYLVESFIRNTIYKGAILDVKDDKEEGWIKLLVKETIKINEEMEAVTPDKDFNVCIEKIKNDEGKEIYSGEPGQIVWAKINPRVTPFTFLRKPCQADFLRL